MDEAGVAHESTRRLTMGDHFSDAVAAIRQPFVVYDAAERLAAFNAAFSDLHRHPDGSPVLYLGMPFQDLMEWRVRTHFFAAGSPEHPGGAATEYRLAKGDVVYQLHDGRWMFVDNCSLPDGRLACTWSDITAVKAAERQLWEVGESLRQSQDHLLRAQRIARIGSIERDLKTHAVRWTAQMYELFGRDRNLPPPTREEIVEFFHPDDRDRYQEEMRAAEHGRRTPPAEFRILRPDGTVRWVYYESEVCLDDEGKPALRLATYKDVSEIHAYQDQQRALQDELLAKERLSAIGELAATVTHELRTPLSTIRNTLHTLREAAVAGRAPEPRQLERIERSIERCNRITADLLEFSRLGPVRCRNHDLDAWLHELVAEPPASDGIAFALDLRAPGCIVGLDPGPFRRAIAQLIANATQAIAEAAAPVERPRIVLRTRRRRRMIECVVEDNGPGMPPEDLARAFDPLFSTRMYGTGLGLPIVKQIVAQHGGEVILTSTPGAGTRASIRLPLIGPATARRTRSQPPESRAA